MRKPEKYNYLNTRYKTNPGDYLRWYSLITSPRFLTARLALLTIISDQPTIRPIWDYMRFTTYHKIIVIQITTDPVSWCYYVSWIIVITYLSAKDISHLSLHEEYYASRSQENEIDDIYSHSIVCKCTNILFSR